jgi:glutamate synthase (NADPH/NADH) small chain
MGDVKGFLKFKRQTCGHRPVEERTKDYCDVSVARNDKCDTEQAARCMDCGTPYCHWACPVSNYIPEWNDLVYNGFWEKAYNLLSATNNFPEFTGRLCPALCEYACVLGINDDPVTIRENELAIVERAFREGFIKPRIPKNRTGKKVAVIGSGPAGLACADQLNKAGHDTTVFEKDKKPGGILRYGIPDFKLDKSVIDRRVKILEQEGIKFVCGVEVSAEKLKKEFDAVCITAGSRVPRDLKIEGRELKGINFAMDYLMQSNRKVSGEDFQGEPIDAKGKSVVVIGGGDTGSDCVGTANRQGATCVTQIELMPRPEECRPKNQPWPRFPMILKTTSSHEEGGERHWSILTKKFTGTGGSVKSLTCIKIVFEKDEKGCQVMKEVPGSQFDIPADLVVLAMGFVYPEKKGLIESLGLELDQRGNIKAGNDFQTSAKNVFAAGDARRGQSLIVWAISEGRKAAHFIDKSLMGKSFLPSL